MLNDKVKIFISSRCRTKDTKYLVARSALKLLLEETGMVYVYGFESSGGSSREVVSGYLSQLEDSDLCIFLIDNDDDVPDAVMGEYTRAKELNKKSLYIFCDETSKTPTKMQGEIGLSSKWDIAHEFAEVPPKAYYAVLNDIIDIYRGYCKRNLVEVDNRDNTDEVNNIALLTSFQVSTKKFNFSSFRKLRTEFGNLYFRNFNDWRNIQKEQEDSTPLDSLCADLFLQIICKKALSFTTLGSLLAESQSIYGAEYNALLSARKEALEAYLSGNMHLCFEKLKAAYEEAKNNSAIPNWLLMDVLIDCRNINSIIDTSNGLFTFNCEWQQYINDNPETLYYPILDRFVDSHNKKIHEFLMQQKTDSPYTSRMGGLDNLFTDNAKAFVVAATNFSLTQLLCTRDRLTDSLTAWCSVYTDHHSFINLAHLLIIGQTEKDLQKDIDAFGYSQNISATNENDVKRLWDAVQMIPVGYKRNISRLILFQYFGYYFSDDNYAMLSSEIMAWLLEWKADKSRLHIYNEYIIEALVHNARRIDNDWLANFLSDMLSIDSSYFAYKLQKLITYIDIKKLSSDVAEKMISTLALLASSDSAIHYHTQVQYCLMLFRKFIPAHSEIIDKTVEERFPDYFSNEYDLEINATDSEEIMRHISRYIAIIINRNEEQGKDGCYSGYSGDPFETLKNIIRIDKPSLTNAQIGSIIDAIIQTLSITTQTIDAQIASIELFLLLCNQFGKEFFEEKIEKLICIAESDTTGHAYGFLIKDFVQTLYFNKVIMKLALGVNCYSELLTLLASYSEQTDYEIIKSLKAIDAFLDGNHLEHLEVKCVISLLQYVTSMSFNNKQEIRYYAASSLIKLVGSQYNDVVMEQLSRMMDTESSDMKIYIVSSIKTVANDQKGYKDFILQKARVDNHYLVREAATEKG